MELDFESRDKQFMELQGLHNSQLQLTSELSDKLEKTELHETEHALVDLEERHRQANATIEEKEYLISSLIKPERKDKIENGNRILIQKFQAQLSQQLESLHKMVAASVTQQEQQLRSMEEYMQLFVSTKADLQLCFNTFQGAIVYSNIVTTVSPTYAQEVRTAEMASTLNMSNFANRDSLLWLESKPVDAMSRASGLDNHGVDNLDEHVNVTNSRLKRMLLQSPLIALTETVVEEEGGSAQANVEAEQTMNLVHTSESLQRDKAAVNRMPSQAGEPSEEFEVNSNDDDSMCLDGSMNLGGDTGPSYVPNLPEWAWTKKSTT
ncbi:hypothetical protein AgCh_032123 [Apium graveolens]